VIATPVVEVDDLEIGRLATLVSVAERPSPPPPPPPPPTWSILEEASVSALSQVGPDRRRITELEARIAELEAALRYVDVTTCLPPSTAEEE